MSTQSRRDLLTRIKELETENEELQTRLDDISDIVAPDEDEDEEEEDDEAEDDAEGDDSGE